MDCNNINELPDYLLTQMLSYLPTKDSVRTSVLSKRWERLWLMVPVIDLNVNHFPLNGQAFASFIDKFLEFNASENLSINHKSRLQKFKIKYNEFINYGDRLGELLGTMVDRKVEHLDVEADMMPSIRDFMPHDIYKSKTLVFLKLVRVGLVNPRLVVSLPCLKTMHLENNFYCVDGPLVMENLISDCPVLEDLTFVRTIDRNNVEFLVFLRVRSRSLKRFRYTFANDRGGTDFSVEIDAPRLEFMSFKDNQSDRIVVNNLSSLLTIDMDTKFNVEIGGSPLRLGSFNKRNTIRHFLTSISSVRHMIISKRTMEVLDRYLKLAPLPQFGNLYRLQAAFPNSLLQLLPVFLENFQNLKSLILELSFSTHPVQIKLRYVPHCLSSTLERVEIKGMIIEEETWKTLAGYFLENSAVLKKLILHFKDSVISNHDVDIFKEIRTFTKWSPNCQIIIHYNLIAVQCMTLLL
ncbi:PREDICTED: F-box/FBD/LRR-repeat protein At2g26030-like [Camelina sativa]|uniref:F-box/FBD/LRR-repeat protein At2g26030-like n=1 Tax=Camelina sativa TaxID=90675 RepID=A0ABM1QLC2_CAMSA|nr:PREDICTED: F-box/FBD/LRR-repeat protein At2g26030-like [Camelina sativa]